MTNFKLILTQAGLGNVKVKSFYLPENQRVGDSGIDSLSSVDLKVSSSSGFQSNTVPGSDEPNGISALGTPVFSNLTLRLPSDSQKVLRMDTVLMTVSMTKNIVKTSIQGRNGTFKEYVSDGDYAVSIRGILTTNNGNQYPKADTQMLYDLLAANDPLSAISDFLSLYGVKNLVVESFNIPQVEGFYNTQPFEITCSSDTPLELFL